MNSVFLPRKNTRTETCSSKTSPGGLRIVDRCRCRMHLEAREFAREAREFWRFLEPGVFCAILRIHVPRYLILGLQKMRSAMNTSEQ